MARKTILMILLIPLVIAMASKDPGGAAAGTANLVRMGAQLLGHAADAANQFLAAVKG
ncbi:MAG TPA: hypothetical protein VMU51_01570 [Mycobacteriales bacterium]|nr:hypothetical protein [Mycobacteriales bacterium]